MKTRGFLRVNFSRAGSGLLLAGFKIHIEPSESWRGYTGSFPRSASRLTARGSVSPGGAHGDHAAAWVDTSLRQDASPALTGRQ